NTTAISEDINLKFFMLSSLYDEIFTLTPRKSEQPLLLLKNNF
ncbi:MAG: hypothetical protein ACI82Q_001966, partial [Nonlabens sp.]